MDDIDLLTKPGRLASSVFEDSVGAQKSAPSARANNSQQAGAPDGDETLAWLAGSRMSERVRKRLMRPRGRADRQEIDRLLQQPPPPLPVEAAARRATTLPQLRKHAPDDPRVEAVFSADPIVVEDCDSGALVTQAMFRARIALFNATLAMIGRPPLSHDQYASLMQALKDAYPHLSEASQIEWALSEMRLEECKAFTGRRESSDLDLLANTLRESMRRSGLWTASRVFSIAAHTSLARDRSARSVSELLELSAHRAKAVEAEQSDPERPLPERDPAEN